MTKETQTPTVQIFKVSIVIIGGEVNRTVVPIEAIEKPKTYKIPNAVIRKRRLMKPMTRYYNHIDLGQPVIAFYGYCLEDKIDILKHILTLEITERIEMLLRGAKVLEEALKNL